MLKRLNLGRGETIEVKIRGLDIPMLLRRSARARRFSLQVSEARRGAVLTMPVYSSFADADEFLSRHLDWLKERVADLPEPVPFTHGAIIPLRGLAHVIQFSGSERRRGVVWVEESETAKVAPAWPAGARVSARRLPRLCVSGADEHAPRRLLDWLKRQAHNDLKWRVDLHAKRLDLKPKRIFVRDQTTRWGSCSTSGALSFSWRLVLAPPFVLDYLAAHEVAHLAHMNHGPRFWALVTKTMPRQEEARNWLRKHGSSLHAYGAEAMPQYSRGSSPTQSIE
ncbi:MAG: SprT family zinc-dependent metalloprotease [Hyphomicrobiales bacterium]